MAANPPPPPPDAVPPGGYPESGWPPPGQAWHYPPWRPPPPEPPAPPPGSGSGHRLAIIVAAIAIVALIAGAVAVVLATRGGTPPPPSPTPTAAPATATPTPVPAGVLTTPPHTAQGPARLGETITADDGRRYTVFSYTPNITDPFHLETPDPGTFFANIDAQECAPAGEGAVFADLDFIAEMPDGSRVESQLPIGQPIFGAGTLTPGQCVRGVITYELRGTPRDIAVRDSNLRWNLG